ncbi:MAG: BstXI family restriction endonuclease [Nitrospirota bacterium]
MALCNTNGCRLLAGHGGTHNKYPTSAWNFFADQDKKKINKAGFATPRGGAKGAYQNHVTRNNKVIIPYEKFDTTALNIYKDDYVVRLYPEQFFEAPRQPKQNLASAHSPIQIGVNAFMLYRTWDSFHAFPPLPEWHIRGLTINGVQTDSRGQGVIDTGHYVLRLSSHGHNRKRHEGPPQGIFATEYADELTNYLCRCVLAFLIVNTFNSPYTANQAEHLKLILISAGLLNYELFEQNGTIRRTHTCCPLCQKVIRYNELHETISFDESEASLNAAAQVAGATRSTIVNLFHLKPLIYHSLTHIPANIGWGHAICNTYLAQRECLSLYELIRMGLKVGIIYDDHIETFGWISDDFKFIRSPNGAVWTQISSDMSSDELDI